MHKKQSIPSFQPGFTLLELIVGVVISLLLFSMVFGMLSQGVTALKKSRNKTHAQEANRITIEQTTALIHSSEIAIPEVRESNLLVTRRNPISGDTETITINKPENGSRLVATTTGSVNKTIGYNVKEIDFSSLPSGPDLGYVTIDNQTKDNNAISFFTTSASPRITHVTGETTAIIAFGASPYTVCNRTGGSCISISTLTLTPNQDMDSLRIIPQKGGIISQQLFRKTTAGTSRTATFDGPTNLPINGMFDSQTFRFKATGTKDNNTINSTPIEIAITVTDPCKSEPRGCDAGYGLTDDQSSPYNPPCKICKKVYSCTDCEGITQISYVSQADADAICNSYYCATTYDCKGDGHLCKNTSLGAAQTCADNLAGAIQCNKRLDYWYSGAYTTTNDMILDIIWFTETYGLQAAHDLRISGQWKNAYLYDTLYNYQDQVCIEYGETCQEYPPYECTYGCKTWGDSGTYRYRYIDGYHPWTWDGIHIIDDYLFSLYTYRVMDHTPAGPLWSGNETENITSNWIKSSATNNWTHSLTKTKYTYTITWESNSPIILDLNGSGVPDVANGDWLPHPDRFDRNRAKQFDMTGEGYFMLTEWVGPQSGLLVTLDENSTVVSALNLFGTAGGWRDGYVKLAALFDKDKNSMVEGNELDGLYVWQDMNMNAKADSGELKTVQDWNITKIWTKHDHYRSLYERNGKKLFTWDWWPSVIDIHEKDRNEMLKGRDLQKHQFINKNI